MMLRNQYACSLTAFRPLFSKDCSCQACWLWTAFFGFLLNYFLFFANKYYSEPALKDNTTDLSISIQIKSKSFKKSELEFTFAKPEYIMA